MRRWATFFSVLVSLLFVMPAAAQSNCCVPNGGVGCDDPACEAAVCAIDPFCCDVAWDGICASEALTECPKLCGDVGGCPTPSGNDCCVSNGTPGCNNDACCAIVCAADAFCCDVAWDSICAGAAEGIPECNCVVGGACDKANPNDCCVANGTPGCNNVACCEIVCAADPFCCDVAWDSICAGAAAGIPECNCGVGGCPTPSGNDCCVSNATPGCNNDACCAIVCAADAFCCDVAWDQLCADAAAGIPECNCVVGGACDKANPNDCCVANGTPGCNDVACCESVCAADPFCCDVAWDSICADEAAADPNCNCGKTDACPPSKNDCCAPSPDGTPGCNNDACCEIVCAADPFCCDVSWDGLCSGAAQGIPECNCGVVGGCDKANPNDCCVANGTPGCNDVACCESVCAADPFCCDVAWDSICADEAAADPNCNCGKTDVCPPSKNDCCAPSPDGTPGCNNDACCEIVCAADPFCCDISWDGLCSGAAQGIPECNCGVVGGCDKANPNDCCVSNDTPGCNQPACCESVCAADPFCCDVAWDGICADAALADPNCDCGPACNEDCPADLAPVGAGDNEVGPADLGELLANWGDPENRCADIYPVGAPDGVVGPGDLGELLANWGPCEDEVCDKSNPNDCCVSNDTPGCNQPACCESVCAADSFCCDVAWDGICADAAAVDPNCLCEPAAVCDKGNPNDCCAPSPDGTPGCNNVACCEIVCAADSFCCEVAWDSICAGAAEGTPECNCGVGGCPTPSGNDCCVSNGTPGCNNDACCAIICAADSFCCDVAWDSLCADAASSTPECNCGGKGSNCCEANGGVGCDDAACEACVCGLDAFCCDVEWDGICASEAANECAASCPCGNKGSNCCVANGGLGCDDAGCEACVCGLDPFCCDVAWDGICAGEAANECAASCPCG